MADVPVYPHEGLTSKAQQWGVTEELLILPNQLHPQQKALELLHCSASEGMQGGAAGNSGHPAACYTSPQQSQRLTAIAPTTIAHALSNGNNTTKQKVRSPVLGRACS